MNPKSLSLLLAVAAGVGAQATDMVDASAREQAAKASASALKAQGDATAAAGLAKVAADQNTSQQEKLDAVDGKLNGLEEHYLETVGTVKSLAKMKFGGLVQVEYKYHADTGYVSGGYPTQQGMLQVRRGRLKGTYTDGNAQYVMQYNMTMSTASVVDMYVKYDEPWLKMFSIQAGYQDIPFGFELGYSSSTMEWLERSRFLNNAVLKGEKDVSAILGMKAKIPGLDVSELKLAALNGYGGAATNDPKAIAAKVNLGKNFYDAGVSFNMGASYFQDSRMNVVGSGGKSAYYVVDGSGDFAKTNSFREELDAKLMGLDAQVSVDMSFIPGLFGAKIMGEAYTGTNIGNKSNNNRTTNVVTDTLYVREVMGWYAAYVQNIGKSFQTVVRYDVYDPNTSVEGDAIHDKKANGGKGNKTSSADIAYNTLYLGFNTFLNGNTKLSIGYDIVRNEESENLWSATAKSNFKEEINDDVLTIRLQFAY